LNTGDLCAMRRHAHGRRSRRRSSPRRLGGRANLSCAPRVDHPPSILDAAPGAHVPRSGEASEPVAL